MTLSINSTPASTASNAGTGTEVLTAKLAKSNQELEGKMALQLIQSASVDSTSNSTAPNLGSHVNIKV